MMENNYIIPPQSIKYKYVKGCFFFTHQLVYLIIASCILSQIPFSYYNMWQLSVVGTVATYCITLLIPFSLVNSKINTITQCILPLITSIYICIFSLIPQNVIVYYTVNYSNIFYLNIYNIFNLIFLMFYKWFCYVQEHNQYMRVATSINV